MGAPNTMSREPPGISTAYLVWLRQSQHPDGRPHQSVGCVIREHREHHHSGPPMLTQSDDNFPMFALTISKSEKPPKLEPGNDGWEPIVPDPELATEGWGLTPKDHNDLSPSAGLISTVASQLAKSLFSFISWTSVWSVVLSCGCSVLIAFLVLNLPGFWFC